MSCRGVPASRRPGSLCPVVPLPQEALEGQQLKYGVAVGGRRSWMAVIAQPEGNEGRREELERGLGREREREWERERGEEPRLRANEQ